MKKGRASRFYEYATGRSVEDKVIELRNREMSIYAISDYMSQEVRDKGYPEELARISPSTIYYYIKTLGMERLGK